MGNGKITNGKADGNSINLMDLFYYLLDYWFWFVLGLLVCGGFAYYRYAKSPNIYQAGVTAVIKNPNNTKTAARMDSYSNLINKTSVSYEMLQFQSRKLMNEVVSRLGANVDYYVKDGLRWRDLYSVSPIQAEIVDRRGDFYSFKVTPKSETTAELEIGKSKKTVNLNDTTDTEFGRVVLYASRYFGPDYIGKEMLVNGTSVSSAAAGLSSGLQITEDGDGILRFSFASTSLQKAKDVLSTIFVVYNEDAIKEKEQVAKNTSEFIEGRLKSISAELSDVERELESFKVSNVLLSTSEAAGQYLSETRSSSANIEELETRLRVTKSLKAYLLDPSKADNMLPNNTGLDDRNIESLIAQYNAAKMNRDRMIADSSPDSPVIKSLDASLASMKESLLVSVNNTIQGLEIMLGDAQTSEQKARSKFSTMPGKERQMLNIERQQKIKEDLYLYMLNKREENALTQYMVDSNAILIDEPDGPSSPVSPNKAKILLLGILCGLLLPAIVLLSRLFLDNRIRTRKDVEDESDVPFVGEIPQIVTSSKSLKNLKSLKNFKDIRKADTKKPIAYDSQNTGLLTESIRVLCTNLDYMMGQDKKVITVSSFNVGAGKSFVSSNLAACYADNGRKVALIDIDLRKRTLSKKLGCSHTIKGLSDYLHDETVTIEDVVIKDKFPGLDFISAGMTPPNPVELLKRDRLDRLVDELKKIYDYIIIDNVPVDVIADSTIVNRVVDTTLFVVRAGVTDRRMLSAVDKMYEDGKFNNLCLVLNGSKLSHGYGNYGYGY